VSLLVQIPKRGLIELASGGTLVLDEISEMSQQLQSKLLRVIEVLVITTKSVVKTPIKVDLRDYLHKPR